MTTGFDTSRRFACIGECMVELSEHGDGTLTRSFGGDTLNTALYLARLGVPVDYVTALGMDALSDAMLSAWAAEGIGTALVARVPGRLPGLYLIRTDARGERQFLYWRDSAPVRQLFALPDAAMIGDAVADAATVYVSGITLSLFDATGRDRLFDLLARARRRGAQVAFDTNFRPRGWPDPAEARDVYARAFRHTDIVFASVEDHALLHGAATDGPAPSSAALSWLQGFRIPEVALKFATPACRVIADGIDAVIPADPVAAVVDTTAAGDSFAAGYLAARRGGCGPADAARAGHRLAGAVVRHHGAIIPRAAMPLPTPPEVP